MSDTTASFNRLEAQLAELVHHVKEVRVSNNRIHARLDAVEERLDRIEARLDRVEGRLDRVEHRLDTVEHRLGNVEDGLRELREAQNRADTFLETEFKTLAERAELAGEIVAGEFIRVRIKSETAFREFQKVQEAGVHRLDDLEKRVSNLEQSR